VRNVLLSFTMLMLGRPSGPFLFVELSCLLLCVSRCSVKQFRSIMSLPISAGPTSPTSVHARECRICLATDNQQDIVQPCKCTGTVQFAHLECLRSWCVNNLSLKCEICGSVYKDDVVDSLMGTLIEAQDRQVAAQGLADAQGIRFDSLDAAARQRESAIPIGRETITPAEAAEAQQRMQAFLDELLQLYVRISPSPIVHWHLHLFIV
jgi:hypothetical protein